MALTRRPLPPWLADLTGRPVIRSAASLFGATVVTSVLGLAYSVVAARMFPISDTGIAFPALSAMQLLGQVGLIGIATMLVGRLAREGFEPGLVSAGAITATFVTFLLGVAFVLLQSVFSTHLGPLGHGLAGPTLFAIGCGLTAFTLILDQVTVGLGEATIQLRRNGVFAAAKLVLLPLGTLVPLAGSVVIYSTWLAGNLVSLVSYWRGVRRAGVTPTVIPNFPALYRERWIVAAHHWLNIADQAPRLLLTVLVAGLLTRQDAAAFYTANLLVAFPTIVPVHLTLALFALPRGQLDRLANEVRATLRVSFAVGLVSAVGIAAVSYPMLLLFGPKYLVATGAMAVLGVNVLPYSVKVHYAAIERVRGNLRRCAIVSSGGAVLEIGLCVVGAEEFGLVGVSGGLVLGLCIEALYLWPVVARAAQVPILGNPMWLWHHDYNADALEPITLTPLGRRVGAGARRVANAATHPRRSHISRRRLTLSPTPAGEAMSTLIGQPHHRAGKRGSLRFVLELDSSAGGTATDARPSPLRGLRLVSLPNPTTAFAAYVLCQGRSPTRPVADDQQVRDVLALPSAMTVAVLDPAQALVGLGIVFSDQADAYLLRLVCRPGHDAGLAALSMVHDAFVADLRNKGVQRLWSAGPPVFGHPPKAEPRATADPHAGSG
jgi:O-antigen/teichoic acid export membrane protein